MRLSDLAANAEADASRALLNDGYLRLLAGEQMLVEQRFGSPAYRRAVGGVADALPLRQVVAALADGTADSYRAYASDGVTLIEDGTVGESSTSDLVLDRAEVRAGALVSVTRLTYRIPVE